MMMPGIALGVSFGVYTLNPKPSTLNPKTIALGVSFARTPVYPLV